jgi:glycine cleavage system H protein
MRGGNMAEFLETTYDKFVFRVKTDYFYNREDFWADVQGNKATVGVTDFLQKSKGDVAILETVEPGTEVRQGKEIGKIETIKATFGIISPVSGKVVEVNSELENSAYLINEDPYGAGWLYKIELTSPQEDQQGLLQANAYFELMKEKLTQISAEMKK